MATLEEKESEMNVMQSSLEQAQRDREEKEQALIEAMNAIHVRETEHEENTVEEVNHEYSKPPLITCYHGFLLFCLWFVRYTNGYARQISIFKSALKIFYC